MTLDFADPMGLAKEDVAPRTQSSAARASVLIRIIKLMRMLKLARVFKASRVMQRVLMDVVMVRHGRVAPPSFARANGCRAAGRRRTVAVVLSCRFLRAPIASIALHEQRIAYSLRADCAHRTNGSGRMDSLR